MKWKQKQDIEEKEIQELANNLDTNTLIAKILLNRGFDIDTSRIILKDYDEAIIEPSKLTNSIQAASIITKYCIDKNAHIIIFGDYDCDGLTATAIMYLGLSEVAECDIDIYIPERSEGYGLSEEFAKSVIENKDNRNTLVITVDNGISQLKPIKLLQDNNIEVVVTDHHNAKETVPDCVIVDPYNYGEPDTFKHLAGCGVSFKITQMVLRNFGNFDMLKYTPYVAIGTLADMMPMSTENIAFVKYALDIINSENCPRNLKVLKNYINKKELTANDIIWEITPRLNACGRMGNVNVAEYFLLSNDEEELEDIMVEIDRLNIERKNITNEVEKILNTLKFDNDPVCIFLSDKYSEGIMGVVANKLIEKFNKPSIALLDKGDIYKGSMRSLPGINIQDILNEELKHGNLKNFGGHDLAAGITIYKDKYEDFKKNLFSKVNDIYNTLELSVTNESEDEQELYIDEIIAVNDINENVFEIINKIPYDNKTIGAPMFALTDVEVVETKVSAKNPNNIKFTLKEKDSSKTIDIWAWGFAKRYEELGNPKCIHLAGTLERDFLFPKRITLKVKDILRS